MMRSDKKGKHRWRRRSRPCSSTTWTAARPRARSASLDGTGYEIDLNAGHAQALRDALARYVRAARRAGGGTRPARGEPKAPAGGPDSTEVREWAKAQGIEVKDRGRVPAEVAARFTAATRQQGPGPVDTGRRGNMSPHANAC